MKDNRQKLYSLQILRGFAAVWVVFCHLEFLAAHYFQTFLRLRLVDAGHLGVHLFFVLSGFIIYWIHSADSGNEGAIRSYFLKRITRIYPLLIVLNVIKLAYMMITGYGVRADKFDLSSIIGSFLLLPTTNNFLIDVTWSLTYEIWFYLGFGILLLLGKRFLKTVGIVYGLLLILLNLPGEPQLEGMAGFVFNPRILEFLLGCGFALFLKRPFGKPFLAGIAWGALGLTAVIIGIRGRLDERLVWLLNCAYWGIAFGLLLFGGLILEKTVDFSKFKIGILLGDASYSIYLAHSLSLNVLAIAFKKFVPNPFPTVLLWGLLGCGVLGVVSGIICYFCIERPFHILFRNWIRDKSQRHEPREIAQPARSSLLVPSAEKAEMMHSK